MNYGTKVKTNQKKPVMNIHHVRAQMVEKGTSLHSWAYRNGFNHVLVLHAIRGLYNGPKARRALELLQAEMQEA